MPLKIAFTSNRTKIHLMLHPLPEMVHPQNPDELAGWLRKKPLKTKLDTDPRRSARSSCKSVLTRISKERARQRCRRKRVKGIEPSSTAWKAVVLAVVLHPQYLNPRPSAIFWCLNSRVKTVKIKKASETKNDIILKKPFLGNSLPRKVRKIRPNKWCKISPIPKSSGVGKLSFLIGFSGQVFFGSSLFLIKSFSDQVYDRKLCSLFPRTGANIKSSSWIL